MEELKGFKDEKVTVKARGIVHEDDVNATFYMAPPDPCPHCLPGSREACLADKSSGGKQFKIQLDKNRLQITVGQEVYRLRVNFCPICGRRLTD